VVLHRQQQSNTTTQKRQRGTGKRKRDKSSSTTEQGPLQLFHRLFEPMEGRKNRKRIIIVDPNDKNAKMTLSKHPKQKGSSTLAANVKVNNTDRSNNDDAGMKPTIRIETPPVVIDLPPSAIIRGSITHKILQKLNRLDESLVHDDPYPSETSNTVKVMVDNDNEKASPIPAGESDSKREEVPKPTTTTFDENGVTSTIVEEGNGVRVEESLEQYLAQVTEESVCVRSTIIPQRNFTSLKAPHIHVVILFGEHRGRTGNVHHLFCLYFFGMSCAKYIFYQLIFLK
jgi:hypothetical protein